MTLEDEIYREVLSSLYLYEFTEDGERNLPSIREEKGWDESTYERVIQRMVYDGLIKGWTLGGNYRICLPGIIEFESTHSASTDVIDTNWEIREAALKKLAESYEERSRSLGIHYSQLFPDTDWTDLLIVRNLQYLENRSFVETHAAGTFKITFDGIDLVEKIMELSAIEEEFDEMKSLNPQKRGMQFQKLFYKIIDGLGWRSLESVRSDNEEIDIVFSKEREYFLVECKWEKDPAEAAVVREIFGKVSNRVGVAALIVSLSGFTKGAKSQVQKYAPLRAILLFGPDDVAQIVKDPSAFNELLDIKYEALVLRQEVIVN